MAAAKKTSAKKSSSKPAAKKPVAGAKLGRGTRWTDADVKLLMETVSASATAKQAFETVAKSLGKSVGTVQQKYYNLQKKSGAPKRRGRKPGSTNSAATATRRATSGGAAGGPYSATAVRALTIDELVSLASRVKDEVDRRKRELDAATALFG